MPTSLARWLCLAHIACTIITIPTIAGELSPVRIQTQVQPIDPSAEPSPSGREQGEGKQPSAQLPTHVPPLVRRAPVKAKPVQAQVELQPVEVEPTEPALNDFETITSDELAQPAGPSPFLADATKNRMFAWREGDHYRAGCPQLVKDHFAMVSSNWRYQAYNVGGGSPFIGGGPFLSEGTWGLDYQGFFPKRVALNWNHGRREQGGVGGYKTDGPKREK